MSGSAPAAPLREEHQERRRDGSRSSQLCHSWHKHCQQGASLAPLVKVTLLMVMPLQQPPPCPFPGTEGSGLGSSPSLLGAGVQERLWGQLAQLSLHRGSSSLPLQQPVWQGQGYIPARTLPAPRQSHCGGEDAVPAPQLVQINQHRIDVSAGTAMGWGGEGQRNFLKGTSPISSLLFFCLKLKPIPVSQVKKKWVGECRGSLGVCGRWASTGIDIPKRQELQDGPSLYLCHLLMLRARGQAEGRHNWWKPKCLFRNHRGNSVLDQGCVQKATSVSLMLLSMELCNC